jgi:hypothetical protein
MTGNHNVEIDSSFLKIDVSARASRGLKHLKVWWRAERTTTRDE